MHDQCWRDVHLLDYHSVSCLLADAAYLFVCGLIVTCMCINLHLGLYVHIYIVDVL